MIFRIKNDEFWQELKNTIEENGTRKKLVFSFKVALNEVEWDVSDLNA